MWKFALFLVIHHMTRKTEFAFPTMRKPLILALAALLPHVAQAQLAAGSVQQNIDQSIQLLPSRPGKLKPLAPIDVLDTDHTESIQRLANVHVRGQVLEAEIQAYWKPSLGQAVGADVIGQFNGWLFARARQMGYLFYARTRVVRQQGQETLEVTLIQPKIHGVRIVSDRADLQLQYGSVVLQRLERHFRAGTLIDTLALDQNLDSATYDLPIELDATLRAVGPDQVDMIVHMAGITDEAGKRLDALLQLNYHGLKSYGRAQALGLLSLRGHEPRATLTMVGQKSEGITYGRAEYESAIAGMASRWRVWGALSDSHTVLGGAAASQGETSEVGAGITQIFDSHRDFVFRQSMELAARRSRSGLKDSGITTTRVHDQQFRMRTVVDNEKLALDASRLDFQFTIGNYSLLEGLGAIDSGGYAKVELGLKHQFSLSEDRSVYALTRLRSQLSSGRLDSYNQIALGGVSGVRAYTTVDGVGDDGALLSLEIKKRLDNGMTLGTFYDAGVVKPLNPQSIEYRRSYSLQAIGLELSGHHQRLHYGLQLAKGIGGYKGWTGSTYNTESRPDNWRLNVALTYFM